MGVYLTDFVSSRERSRPEARDISPTKERESGAGPDLATPSGSRLCRNRNLAGYFAAALRLYSAKRGAVPARIRYYPRMKSIFPVAGSWRGTESTIPAHP